MSISCTLISRSDRKFAALASIVSIAALASCVTREVQVGEAYTTMRFDNTLSMVRNDETVVIPLSEIRSRFKTFDEHDFSVQLMPATWYEDRGDPMLATNPPPEIPAQLVDTDFDGTPDSLLVICDFQAGEKRFVAIASPRYSRLAKKVGPQLGGGLFMRETVKRAPGTLTSEGKYVEVANAVLDPLHTKSDGLYQGGGPLFETDTSAWRFLFDTRMCFDVIGKRERGMFLQPATKGFLGDSIDLTKTTWGGSLFGECEGFGAGAFGYSENGTVVPMAGFDSAQFRMIRNGPAAIESELLVTGAKLGKETFDLRWRVTQSAGSCVLRHDVNVSRGGHSLAFAMNGSGEKKALPSGTVGWMRVSNWGAAATTGGEVGVGILANGRTTHGFVKNPADVIGVEFEPSSRNFTFYTVGAWSQEPVGMRSAADFQKLLDETAQRIEHPINVINRDKAIGS